MSALSEARSAIAAGVSVIPIGTEKRPDGAKLPPDPTRPGKTTWTGYQHFLATELELQSWFGPASGSGVAVVAGEVSGNLLCLDVETGDIWNEVVEIIDAHEPGLVDKLIWVRTPSGGMHAWFRTEEEFPTVKLAHRPNPNPEPGKHEYKTLIETRGKGGYALIPGSPPHCHPLNKVYEWGSRRRFKDLPTLKPAELALMIDACRSFDCPNSPSQPKEPPKPKPRPQQQGHPGMLPGDWYDHNGDWSELLVGLGWTLSHVAGDVQYWRRPGKAKGTSATLGAANCLGSRGEPLFYPFTTSCAPFEYRKPIGLFNAFAAAHHGGDHKAAAAAVRVKYDAQIPGGGRMKPQAAKPREFPLDQPAIAATPAVPVTPVVTAAPAPAAEVRELPVQPPQVPPDMPLPPVPPDLADAGDLGGDDEPPSDMGDAAEPSPPEGNDSFKPCFIPMSNFVTESVPWFWRLWMARQCVTMLDGDPGLAKSSITLDIAARITRGWQFPPLGGTPIEGREPASVLLMAAEDNPKWTIRPRLDAAGADVNKVFFFSDMRNSKSKRWPTLDDLADAVDEIKRLGIKLIIIDPLAAYVGQQYDMNKDQSIRLILSTMNQVAAQADCSILILRHLNKLTGGAALYRGAGSVGIVGNARTAWMVGVDPEDPTARVLCMQKSNIGAFPMSLRYRVDPVDGTDVARIAWMGETELSYLEVMAGPVGSRQEAGRPPVRMQEATEFLQERFAANEFQLVPAIEAAAADRGISAATLRRAKQALGVESTKIPGTPGNYWRFRATEGNS